MKKLLLISVIAIFVSAFSQGMSTSSPNVTQTLKSLFSWFTQYFKSATPRVIILETDDGLSFKITSDLIDLSPVLQQKANSPGPITSKEIPQLAGAPAVVIKALIDLMQKEIDYKRPLPDQKSITKYFSTSQILLLEKLQKQSIESAKTGQTIAQIKERQKDIEKYPDKWIKRRFVHYDLPVIEKTLSTPWSFDREKRIREQLDNLIKLFRIAHALKLALITQSIAQYIAQQYIANIQPPSWFNIPFYQPEAVIKSKYFADLKKSLDLDKDLKILISENAIQQQKDSSRFSELVAQNKEPINRNKASNKPQLT